MKTSTSEGKHGIQWSARMQLYDLDFADDLALLLQSQRPVKLFRYNTACTNPVTIDGEGLEDVKTFTYLSSIIDEQCGSDADVKARSAKQEQNIYN
ncbi:unnamed protein product [Schistosoma margrebowiei]|uniref:Uncharacterized protein n=1 Tax=Schistosoma margrebowiei TaxID=48269 RepID=A0A183LV15_9TREM|nr:unnamed protein product [Schistosoma margrebowiei]VDP39277.1 unnamed protein product [Schistosoma margrebowiei]